jgi:ribonuclease R
LYRIHESPDPIKLEALATFVEGLGLPRPGGGGELSPGGLRKLLEDVDGRPEYSIIAQVVLRSMKQAAYAAANVGHFGLAAPVYCHFTSPIRRYPDLVVHRALRATRGRRTRDLGRLAQGLDGIAEASSTLERNAERAERELLAWKTMVFMKGREGDELDGVVVGVAAFGLFVRLTDTHVEGLVRLEGLGDDRFDYAEARQELRGRRTRKTFRLGQAMRVRVVKVDTVLRRLDLERVGATTPQGPRGPKKTRGRRR